MDNKQTGLIRSVINGIKQGVVKSWGEDLGVQPFSAISGDGILNQTFWQFLTGVHSFNRKGLDYLVETGYTLNPAGFGIITKITLAQSSIVYSPYWNGKPYKSKTFSLDMSMALKMLLTTGNVFIWKKEVIGFPKELTVLNTLDLQELYVRGAFKYKYNLGEGNYIDIPYSDFIHIKIEDISGRQFKNLTQMGLSPLQAAIMPIEALKEMYTADTALLKNKGRDVLITNGSDTPLLDNENQTNDEVLNERIRGAHKTGGVATSNAKLQVLNLGRTIKELALWDGYKVKKRDLCDVLQVDSGLFNDPDNKTYANRTEAEKSLYTSCVIPFVKLITENKKLKEELGFEVFLDVSNIECLQISQSLKFEKNNTIQTAIISLNQSVKDNVISKDIAVSILENEWNYDNQEAAKMIFDHKPADQTNITPIIDNTL